MLLWLHLANSEWKSRRPWLGMEMTNLYAASVGKLEKIISKFNISKGVLVEEVHEIQPEDEDEDDR
ncbi:unnamed protein product [Camellia sinensis]